MGKDLTAQAVKTVPEKAAYTFGLDPQMVLRQRKKFGYNELPKQKGISIGKLFIEQCTDFMVLILLAATGISWYLGETMDAATILAIVLLNALLGVTQEYKAEKALLALKKMSAPRARVIRAGRMEIIPAREVVPGDLLLVEAGDRIVADACLVEHTDLEADESILTGESLPAVKSSGSCRQDFLRADPSRMIYSGTVITRGKGKAVATAIGVNTEVGRIAEMIATVTERDTPLQKRLKQLGRALLVSCLIICAAVGAAGVVRGEPWREMFMTVVSLAVAAIPEGLPAIVTIALAIGVQKMVKQRAIIRKLPAVETLGCATVICSDKTGTLTENRMRVEKIILDGKEIALHTGGSCALPRKFRPGSNPVMEKLLINCLVNNSAVVSAKRTRKSFLKAEYEIFGDPTEKALLEMVEEFGWDLSEKDKYGIRREIPFTSERKRMGVVYAHDGALILAVKGAPEVIAERCGFVYQYGREVPLTDQMRKDILLKVRSLSGGALRVLAFAFRRIRAGEIPVLNKCHPDQLENELVFIGLAGMMDPPRPEVPPAVSRAHAAGIKVKVITGDHPATAGAVARLIGLPCEKICTGGELEKLRDADWPALVKKCSVFARVSPAHKLLIVRYLKSQGEVVAMTGDGVNDAPAVKEADIGVAMGISGTEVTKEASAMVVADDNFATIVGAVDEGRNIYENIRKFIRYLLGCNIGEVLVMFFATVFGLPIPLLPIQLLFVNLVTDGLPAIALGVDPNSEDLMKQKPRPPAEGIFARGLGARILAQGALIGITSLIAFVYGMAAPGGSVETGRTMAFGTLVFSQLCYVFQCRSERKTWLETGIFGNMYLAGAVLVSALMQLIIMTTPFFMRVFHTAPLTPLQWAAVFGLAGISLIWTEWLRRVKRAFIPKVSKDNLPPAPLFRKTV
ncbi:MAG: cation-translocating P-type ATPase [Bacillota bacterium]